MHSKLLGTSLFIPDVDTTKDPCQKVKCSRHKVCVAQGYQRAVCVNRKTLEHRWALQLQDFLHAHNSNTPQDGVCFLGYKLGAILKHCKEYNCPI